MGSVKMVRTVELKNPGLGVVVSGSGWNTETGGACVVGLN